MLRDFFFRIYKDTYFTLAAKEPVYGLWLNEELSRHGYKLSLGTLYPILRKLEREKLLTSFSENVEGKIRRGKNKKCVNRLKAVYPKS